jgi:hypothetical protein
MLSIKEEDEACDEVDPLVLPKPLEEVIVDFLGGKYIDKLVTSVSKSDKYFEALDEDFLRLLFSFLSQRKDQIHGVEIFHILMNEIGWS